MTESSRVKPPTDHRVPAQKPKPPSKPVTDWSNAVTIFSKEGDDAKLAAVKAVIGPFVTNSNALSKFGRGSIGELSLDNIVAALAESSKLVNANDLKEVEATLFSQATVLNVMFGELTRRSAANMGEYFETSERYFKMAMKAQNQCRMTLETLSNIKNPPIVYARQANITNGPQQVNNNATSHAHAEENKIPPSKVLEESNEQRMDTRTQSQASGGNPKVEAMATGNRP